MVNELLAEIARIDKPEDYVFAFERPKCYCQTDCEPRMPIPSQGKTMREFLQRNAINLFRKPEDVGVDQEKKTLSGQ